MPSDLPPLPPATRPRAFVRKLWSVILGISGLLVVSLLIGGGAILAGRVWDPEWNPFRPSADKMIGAAVVNMENARQLHSDIALHVLVAGNSRFQADASASLDADVSDPARPRVSGTLQAASLGNVIIPGNNGINAKYTLAGGDMYVVLEQSIGGALSVLAPGYDFQKAKGAWIKFPWFAPENTGEAASEKTAVAQILSQGNLVTFKKKLPDQKAQGQLIYRYQVALNKDNFSAAVRKIAEARLHDAGQANAGADTSFLIGQYSGILAEVLDKVGEIDLELSIGSRDNYLYGVVLDPVQLDMASVTPGLDVTLSLRGGVNNSRINQPVNIAVPSSFIDSAKLQKK